MVAHNCENNLLYRVYQKNGNRTLACYRAFNMEHTEIILA